MLHEHNKPHGKEGPATPMPHALLPSGELPRAGGTTSKGRVYQLPSRSMRSMLMPLLNISQPLCFVRVQCQCPLSIGWMPAARLQ